MNKPPKYYYQRHLGGFRVYERISDGISESVEYYPLEKDAKQDVYNRNGWNLNKNIIMKEKEINFQEEPEQQGSGIELIQVPIITHRLKDIGLSVTRRIEELNISSQIATDDTIQFLKKTKAELVKEASAWELQRKAVKTAILSPYDEFESLYKAEIIDKYKEADAKLKDTIGAFELKIRAEKKNNVIRYFDELCTVEKIDWLKFERLNIDIQLSITEKKYKEQVFDFIKKVTDDIALINSEKFAAEMMVAYKTSLNSSLAITSVRKRKEDEAIELQRIKQAEIDRRENMLRKINMIYHDFTKTYNFVSDEKIMLSKGDVENLSKEDWNKKFVESEGKIKAFNTAKIVEQAKPILSEPLMPSNAQIQIETPVTPVVVPEVLKAPEKIEPEVVIVEELCEVTFSVTDTYDRLTALNEFLKSNNYQYKQIE